MGQAGSASFPFSKQANSCTRTCARLSLAKVAVFPTVTGVLAQRFGPVVLHPVVVVLLVGMASVFFFIPSVERRAD